MDHSSKEIAKQRLAESLKIKKQAIFKQPQVKLKP